MFDYCFFFSYYEFMCSYAKKLSAAEALDALLCKETILSIFEQLTGEGSSEQLEEYSLEIFMDMVERDSFEVDAWSFVTSNNIHLESVSTDDYFGDYAVTGKHTYTENSGIFSFLANGELYSIDYHPVRGRENDWVNCLVFCTPMEFVVTHEIYFKMEDVYLQNDLPDYAPYNLLLNAGVVANFDEFTELVLALKKDVNDPVSLSKLVSLGFTVVNSSDSISLIFIHSMHGTWSLQAVETSSMVRIYQNEVNIDRSSQFVFDASAYRPAVNSLEMFEACKHYLDAPKNLEPMSM